MTTREWSFGINDPRLSGWVITVGYFISFALCLWAGIKAKNSAAKVGVKGPGGGRPKGRGLWFLFAVNLFLLGVKKQLDL
jgi:hypothetical protein